MKFPTIIFILSVFLFISCSPKTQSDNVSKTILIDTTIHKDQTFHYNLGRLDNNEGTGISLKPQHAEINEMYSDSTTAIVYKYQALEDYAGQDFVELYRERNDIENGINVIDTIKISFTIE